METVRYIDAKLYDAADKGNIDMFKDYSAPLDCLVTPKENTILHIYLKSPNERSTDFIKEVLKICPSLLLKVNNNGDTPLHIAARYGHSDAVKVLINHAKTSPYKDLEEGATATPQILLRKVNKNKDTALHEAARKWKGVNIVKVLAKEDPEFPYSANAYGETPLYLAADNRCTASAIEMLNSYNPQSLAYSGPKGKTALHVAIMHWEYDLIPILLEKMANLAEEKDENGWTPLHYAAAAGWTSIVNKLLDKYSLAAYATDKERKRTALHFAACHGNVDAVDAIILKCPDCCELIDDRGWNVLHHAVISKSNKLVKAILQFPSLLYLSYEKDIKGNTPLHLLFASRPRPSIPAMIYKFSKPTDYVITKDQKKEILQYIQDLGSGPNGKIFIKIDKDRKEIVKEIGEKVEKAKESHLVAAALVATVTFAAAFTVPGGYVSDENNSEQAAGSPILSKNLAFKVFIITDAIAMVLSTSSVFIHFMMAVLGYKERYYWLLNSGLWFILLAMGAMVVAFVTGIYAVLSPASGVAIPTCVIGLSFFLYVFYTTIMLVGDAVKQEKAEHRETSTFDALVKVWHQSAFYFSSDIIWCPVVGCLLVPFDMLFLVLFLVLFPVLFLVAKAFEYIKSKCWQPVKKRILQ